MSVSVTVSVQLPPQHAEARPRGASTALPTRRSGAQGQGVGQQATYPTPPLASACGPQRACGAVAASYGHEPAAEGLAGQHAGQEWHVRRGTVGRPAPQLQASAPRKVRRGCLTRASLATRRFDAAGWSGQQALVARALTCEHRVCRLRRWTRGHASGDVCHEDGRLTICVTGLVQQEQLLSLLCHCFGGGLMPGLMNRGSPLMTLGRALRALRPLSNLTKSQTAAAIAAI